ncbi:uncharacterized protein LOC144445539 isoform X2 [Glandiceps talaboti]
MAKESYEDEVLAQNLEWSDDHYTLRQFVEKYENDLPQILQVHEGVYGSNEDDVSFSTGDVCKIHGVRRESKILATVRKRPGNSLEKITIPRGFNGMLAVIPDGHMAVNPENEYSVDELLDQFELPVKAKFTNYDRDTHAMLHELGGADTIFNLMREVQETYVIGSTKVDGVRYMCIMTLDYDDVEFFVAEDDSADYELIVDKFKLPNIEVGKMNNMPYLEYYEKPKVYKQEAYIYQNFDAPGTIEKKKWPSPGPKLSSRDESHRQSLPPTLQPPPINRKLKPPSFRPSRSQTSPPSPPARPQGLAQARQQKVIPDRAVKKSAVMESVGLPKMQPPRRDSYENVVFKSKFSISKEKEPIDIKALSVKDVANILRTKIKVPEETVNKFIDFEIDGRLLNRILEKGDNSLEEEFKISSLSVTKIKMYILDGWRPNTGD